MKAEAGNRIDARGQLICNIDLCASTVLVLFTLLVVMTPLSETGLAIIFGLPFLLFLPGYALTAALFTKKNDLDVIERITLSAGMSMAMIPATGFILNYTPLGINLVTITTSVSFFILLLNLAAFTRRIKLATADRFCVL